MKYTSYFTRQSSFLVIFLVQSSWTVFFQYFWWFFKIVLSFQSFILLALLGYFLAFLKSWYFFGFLIFFSDLYPLTPHQVLWILCWKNCKVCFIFWAFAQQLFFASDATFFSQDFVRNSGKKQRVRIIFNFKRFFYNQQKRIFRFLFRISNERIFSWLERFCEKMTRKSIKLEVPKKRENSDWRCVI